MSSKILIVETWLMAHSEDINKLIPKIYLLFNYLIILVIQQAILCFTAFSSITVPKLLDIQTLNLAFLTKTPK